MKIRRARKHNVPLSHSNLTTHENMRSHFDPNGSYTGVPEKHGYPDVPDGEKPVQDVDDLWAKIVAEATATRNFAYCREPRSIYCSANRASPLCSQNTTGKNSNRNSARVLAWWARTLCASGYMHDMHAKRTRVVNSWLWQSYSLITLVKSAINE